MYTYADLPDDIRTKRFLPFGKHLWRLYQEVGSDYYKDAIQQLSTDFIYDFLRLRLDESIQTAKAVMDGEVSQPDKILSYLLFPPILPIRGDLNQGSVKLIYGESCDMTFVIVNDETQEIFFMFNGHCEDGVPVDWFLIGPDDDILERRHLKFGYKLKEMPLKTKEFFKAGERLTDILKDIRNERTPWWAESTYIVCMVWGTGVINLIGEPSNYEQFSWSWDGINGKKLGLPDTYFGYIPWPSMLSTFMMAGRKKWTLSLTGLTTAFFEYIMPLEEDGVKWVIDNLPELWEIGVLKAREKGVPYPWQSLECKLPNYKKKSTYEKEEFDFWYPPGDWITPENLDLTIDETCRGVYLDIDHETPKNVKAGHDNIISMGIGKNTEFFK